MDAPRTRVTTRRGAETKASFKTTEFMVFIVVTIGALLASYLVKATDGRGDYFLADKAGVQAEKTVRCESRPRPARPQNPCGGPRSVRSSAALSRCGWGGRCVVEGLG